MDIRADYPANKGFSVRNLKYMAKFAATYSEQEFVQQAVAQIPWGHTSNLTGELEKRLPSVEDIQNRIK